MNCTNIIKTSTCINLNLGAALWNSEDVENYKITVRHPKQETRWTGYLSEDETFAMLGVDGSGGIGIDIKIGKLDGSGTFNFLTQYQVIS